MKPYPVLLLRHVRVAHQLVTVGHTGTDVNDAPFASVLPMELLGQHGNAVFRHLDRELRPVGLSHTPTLTAVST